MRRINVGIIGCGAIAESAHVPNLLSIPQAKIEGICDIKKDRLVEIGEKFNIKHTYSDYEELLKNKDIESVVIATPAHNHAEIVLSALEHGKSVFVEKPITTSIEDAKKIVKTSEKLGLQTMVGYQLRFLPNHIKVRELIDKGEIGDIHFAHIRAETLVIKPDETLLVDYATHNFDLIHWYFEKYRIKDVRGLITTNEEGEQIASTSLLRFESGLHASIESIWTPNFNWGVVDRTVEAVGSRGKISTKLTGPEIKIWRSNSLRDKFFGEKVILPKQTLSTYTPLTDYAYRKELELFIESIIKDKPVPAGPREGLLALEIADATLKSALNGDVVKL